MLKSKSYIAIDLKSFYASVECIERGLDPLNTNLVVADSSRTDKTICLAVSPSLKSFGVPGRPRLFEVKQKIGAVNNKRRYNSKYKELIGESHIYNELTENKDLAVGFIVAPPRMAYYINYSTKIYEIYLKYVAPEDIHVYSIDEVFIDVTNYLNTYKMSAKELAKTMVTDVLKTTGITATCGIGTNMYLCKVAMDIVAKHIAPDSDGVRIAELDEMSYRKLLWTHEPITDFWRVGSGYAKKLRENGLYTMGDIAKCSIGNENEYYNEDLLYRLFGVNAELLIDHAWGYEPCTINDIKTYKPRSNSVSSGQVLQSPYTYEMTRIIVNEMAEQLALDLVEKKLVTNQIVLTIGYDAESLRDKEIARNYKGEFTIDYYGRKVPKHAHGTGNINEYTSSSKLILSTVNELFERIVDSNLLSRRINITACKVKKENEAQISIVPVQLDLFTDYGLIEKEKQKQNDILRIENGLQKTVLDLKNKFGKNAVLKGISLQEGATARSRNRQIGGHRA